MSALAPHLRCPNLLVKAKLAWQTYGMRFLFGCKTFSSKNKRNFVNFDFVWQRGFLFKELAHGWTLSVWMCSGEAFRVEGLCGCAGGKGGRDGGAGAAVPGQ